MYTEARQDYEIAAGMYQSKGMTKEYNEVQDLLAILP